MRVIKFIAKVSEDGKLVLDLPTDIAPGFHRVVLIIDEQVEQQVTTTSTEKTQPSTPTEPQPKPLLNLHMIAWDIIPEDTSFNRAQIYNDPDN